MKSRGFTLIEVLISVAISGILAYSFQYAFLKKNRARDARESKLDLEGELATIYELLLKVGRGAGSATAPFPACQLVAGGTNEIQCWIPEKNTDGSADTLVRFRREPATHRLTFERQTISAGVASWSVVHVFNAVTRFELCDEALILSDQCAIPGAAMNAAYKNFANPLPAASSRRRRYFRFRLVVGDPATNPALIRPSEIQGGFYVRSPFETISNGKPVRMMWGPNRIHK